MAQRQISSDENNKPKEKTVAKINTNLAKRLTSAKFYFVGVILEILLWMKVDGKRTQSA